MDENNYDYGSKVKCKILGTLPDKMNCGHTLDIYSHFWNELLERP